MNIIKLLFPLLLVLSLSLHSQTNFNVNAYKQFLQSNQNMTASQLLEMHPAGIFKGNINLNYSDALYFDSINAQYNFTDYEKSLIQSHGFMVSERLKKISFGQSLLDIYHQDLPVFISTDAILHAFHISYDRILKDVELGYLIPQVSALLTQLHAKMPQLNTKYSSSPEMLQMLKDVDVYLTVPRKLLGEQVNPYYSSNSSKVNYLYSKAFAGIGFGTDTLFADACVRVDWSQFTPRGHYANDPHNPILEKYFRAMMWLGRIEIYLIPPKAYPDPPCVVQDFEDAKRQSVLSYLLIELMDMANMWQSYTDFEKVIGFFVGEQDNVTAPNLLELKAALQFQNADELLDSLKLIEFQDSLKQQSFAFQKILSQILINNPTAPDSIVPASAFMLFGQRFVIDSYVTGSVVFDRILYNNTRPCRLFPKTLDPLFAFGNNATAQLLKDELEAWKYSSNLAALRYLIDSYDQEFWDATIYNSWLNSLRKLNPPDDREDLPMFMQTAAFWQQKINTQLSSWTELRHDNLLYAKQSYTGGTICSYPYTYVEPFPEFYTTLNNYASISKDKFINLPFNDPELKQHILDYLNNLKIYTDTLISVSEKTLQNIPYTPEEILFLKTVVYDVPTGSGDPFLGWYPKLFYRDFEHSYDGLMKKDHIVADIHTTPTDCGGTFYGWVTHVGTGPVNLGVFVADVPGTPNVAFIGPVMSYYEYVTTNFKRLTDQEWDNQYLQSALRPDWVNLYLADSTGNSRGSGGTLVTSVEKDPENITVASNIIVNNYPNPFNPSTIISFNVPYDLTNSRVELKIYNLQGELIKVLVNDILPSGNYLSKWEGENDKGAKVSSGVYIYNLKVADRFASGKMTLVK